MQQSYHLNYSVNTENLETLFKTKERTLWAKSKRGKDEAIASKTILIGLMNSLIGLEA